MEKKSGVGISFLSLKIMTKTHFGPPFYFRGKRKAQINFYSGVAGYPMKVL